jgi:CRP-like cAMP-binding protein
MEPVLLQKGELLFRDGDSGELLYVVSRGELSVIKEVDGESRELARLPAGTFVGELSMLNGEPRSATVVARTDCLLRVYDRSSFEDLLHSNPSVAIRLVYELASRLQRSNDMLAQLRSQLEREEP